MKLTNFDAPSVRHQKIRYFQVSVDVEMLVEISKALKNLNTSIRITNGFSIQFDYLQSNAFDLSLIEWIWHVVKD